MGKIELSENAENFMFEVYGYKFLKEFRDEWFPKNSLKEVAYALEIDCTLEDETQYTDGFLAGVTYQKKIALEKQEKVK